MTKILSYFFDATLFAQNDPSITLMPFYFLARLENSIDLIKLTRMKTMSSWRICRSYPTAQLEAHTSLVGYSRIN